MPPATTIKKFIESVRDRKSEIAVTLQDAGVKCNDPNDPQYPAYRDELRDAIEKWNPTQPLSAEMIDLLKLDPKMVKHIHDWQASPTVDMQIVKDAALDAIGQNPRNIEFFWEIEPGAGTNSKNVVDHPPQGTITVTFSTPRGNVSKKGITHGEIKVDI
jgi:hypothetical protein